jgi:LCP family protein required for cell wall assembly
LSTAGKHRPATKPKRHHSWKRVAVGVTSTALLLITATSGVAVLKVNQLEKKIGILDTSELDNGNRPKAVKQTDTSATNILIMGSDARTGAGNSGYGYVSGARSDTTLLVHVYEGRKSALAVSIPRDSYVTIPHCSTSNGGSIGPWTTKFNAAFAFGGPICTIKTIEATTGVRVDRFVVLDFNAFKQVVDAVGGVQVCLTTPVYDPYIHGIGGSGLNLPAGISKITGEDALKFVRARESLGDGSDISRIQRQQEFISSMVKGIKDKGVLTNPGSLYTILSAVTSSLTTSRDFATIGKLQDFALSISGMSLHNIKFTTVPNEYIANGNVGWLPSAKLLWASIRKDKQWPPAKKPKPSPSTSGSVTASSTPTASPSKSPSLKLVTAPSDVHVIVMNASGQDGLGYAASNSLRARGFLIDNVTSTTRVLAGTKVRYNPSYSEGAKTAAYSARTTELVEDKSLKKAVVVVIGKDWKNARAVHIDSSNGPINGPGAGTNVISAGDSICSAGNNRTKS